MNFQRKILKAKQEMFAPGFNVNNLLPNDLFKIEFGIAAGTPNLFAFK